MMRISLAVILFIPLFASAASFPIGSWSGTVTIKVKMIVVDGASGNPVSGAKIWLLTTQFAEVYKLSREVPEAKMDQPIETWGVRVLSREDGSAEIQADFGAYGGIFIEDGVKKHSGQWTVAGFIEVTAPGYRKTEISLEDLISHRSRKLEDLTLEVVIRIKNTSPLGNRPNNKGCSGGGAIAEPPTAPLG